VTGTPRIGGDPSHGILWPLLQFEAPFFVAFLVVIPAENRSLLRTRSMGPVASNVWALVVASRSCAVRRDLSQIRAVQIQIQKSIGRRTGTSHILVQLWSAESRSILQALSLSAKRVFPCRDPFKQVASNSLFNGAGKRGPESLL